MSPGRRPLSLRLSLVSLLLPAVLAAQAPRWIVRSLPHADLWYASLAQIPFEGSGELPLYSADHAQRIRDAKRAAGVTTLLDAERTMLHTALARDSAFAVLHVVPVYFVGTDRAGMLAALRTVVEGRDPAALSDARARFGATILGTVLTTPDQRATLGRLVAAVEDEWQQFYGRWWTERAAARERRADSAQALFDRDVAHRLAPVLSRAALDSGLILVSPALGAEGRVFAGAPANRADNVVAVRLPDDPAVAAVSVVREICYPVASGVVTDAGGRGRQAAERVSGRLAVRCGEILLAAAPAPLRETYARAYAGARSIADVFAVDSALLGALRRRLAQP